MKEPVVSMTLGLQKTSEDTVVSLKQGDTVGKLAIRLSEDGFPYEIAEDCYAVLAATKPDGTLLYNRCLVEGNTVFYEITEQTTAVPGRLLAEVRLYGRENQLVKTASFCMAVQETVCDDEMVESSDEVSALTHLVSQSLEMEQRSKELLALADTAEKAAAEVMTLAEEASGRIAEAVSNANAAADRADRFPLVAQEAKQKAEEAIQNVSTLREVVSKFHSNIQEMVKGEVITVSDASDLPLAGLKVFGKTEQNGIPTPEAPVELVSVGDSVTVTVCGKNLLRTTDGTYTVEGVKWTISNGAFNAVGAANGTLPSVASVSLINMGYKKGTYYVYGGTDNIRVQLSVNDGTGYKSYLSGSSVALNDFDTYVNIIMQVFVPLGVTVNETAYPMLTMVSDPTYEPYKATTATVTPKDSSGKSVYLPGIPVTSGGNYTDPVTKQQWVCDEVDFEEGVYVQRVVFKEMNGTESVGAFGTDAAFISAIGKNIGMVMCNVARNNELGGLYSGRLYGVAENFSYNQICIRLEGLTTPEEYKAFFAEMYAKGTPVVFAYGINERETDLSEEERAPFAALYTNYPNTTVFNDQNAGMEVKYVADTRLYIDQKFAQLATALVNRT